MKGRSRGAQADKDIRHPYYRTLYGPVDDNMDVALACLIIFDEVILPAADTPIAGENLTGDSFSVPEFGIEGNWHFTHEAAELVRHNEEELVHDPEIAQILRRVPARMRSLVVEYAITDALLMQEFRAPVICRPGRAAIINRMLTLDAIPLEDSFRGDLMIGRNMDRATREYVEVTGLTFQADSAERFTALKWSDTVRSYAAEFQKILTNLQDGDDALWSAIAEARSSSSASSDISGYFTATSRTFSLVSLVPGLGLVAGPAAVLTDWASGAANKRSQTARWYELDSAIAQRRSALALDEALHARGLD